ncbi:MAG: DNA primase [Candidatus Azambacteria bacterium]|nr:DNA primase [Candidatus Azambacteria bacterium]
MDQAQEIKERLNIVDVLSGYIRLTKAGVNYKALCPFHNEKTPSFMVSPSRQTWHCFGGCGEGGDIFTFIEKIEGVEFIEALKMLAEKAGVILEYVDPKLRTEKDRMYEICEKAAQFFTASLNNTNILIDTNNTNENPILNYLYKRGLIDKTIEEWRLGYAPDSWDSLLVFLKSKGYKESEIERMGLVIKSDPRSGINKYHDRFRNRLMFPIFDVNGRVIAFSGRLMSEIIASQTEREGSGKYVNSPETALYSKSRALYGLDRAKTEIRKNNKVILVEGQMDILLPFQDGVRNIVATSGTALTEDHLMILKRLTENLVLAFDMDDAGFKATKRGIELAQSNGFNISVLEFESGKDPADFVKERPGELIKMLQNARPIMSYYFNQVFRKFDVNKIDGKKIVAITLLSEIKRLPSAIERSGWIRELSLKLGVSERDLEEEMSKVESQNADNFQRKSAENPRLSASKTRKEILSERLLALLLKAPELVKEAVKIASVLSLSDFEVLSAFAKASADKSADRPADEISFSDIRSALRSDLRPRLDFLYLAGDYEIEKSGPDFNPINEIKYLINDIEKEHYKEMLNKIEIAIKKNESLSMINGLTSFSMENNGRAFLDGKNLETLTKEFQNISNKLYQLNEK